MKEAITKSIGRVSPQKVFLVTNCQKVGGKQMKTFHYDNPTRVEREYQCRMVIVLQQKFEI